MLFCFVVNVEVKFCWGGVSNKFNDLSVGRRLEIIIGGVKMKNKNDITKNLGMALKYYREDRGMSMSDLSLASGVSCSYISRLELSQRKAPSIVLLHKIAKGLSIPIEALLDISKPETGETILDFAGIILANEFKINEKIVDMELKKYIIELIGFIVDSENEDKNKIIYKILDKVDDIRRAI